MLHTESYCAFVIKLTDTRRVKNCIITIITVIAVRKFLAHQRCIQTGWAYLYITT